MTLTTSDRLELFDLYARYTHTIDDLDQDGWTNTFDPDGSLVMHQDGGANVFDGRAGVTAFYDAFVQSVADAPVRHYTSNIALADHADGAAGRAYLMVLDTRTRTVLAAGYYDDLLVKIADGWRFSRRELRLDPTVPA